MLSNCSNCDCGYLVELVQQQGAIPGLVATSISLPVVSSVPAVFTSQMPQQQGNKLLLIERQGLKIMIYRIMISFLLGARDISVIPTVQTNFGAHPAFCSVGTGCSFSRSKAVVVWSWSTSYLPL